MASNNENQSVNIKRAGMTKVPLINLNILLIIIYLSFIWMGLPDSMLGPAWPSMYGSLNTHLHYAGYISMIISGGRVLSSIFCERIIRRFGTGTVVAAGFLTLSAALFGFSFSSSFLIMCLWSVPYGLGIGFADVALNNYVTLHYKARHMNWLHCFWGIGASIGPVIMSFFLVNKNSWNMGYRAAGIIQCCLVVVLFFALSLWEKEKKDERTKIKNTESIHYKELFSTPGVKQILVVFFLYCSVQVTAVLWGSSFLVTEKNINPETAAQWISLFFIGLTLGRFISGFLTMKLTNRQIVRISYGFIICGVTALLLPVERILLVPGFFMIGIGCAPIFPCLLHETPVSFGNEKSRSILGMQMAGSFIGALSMPPVFGQLASFAGFKLFPVFLGALAVLSVIVFEIANKKIDKNRMSGSSS
ncbi:MAG: MFS transporter [Treponema sp.]|nr:MFS transporter [Treponema sp.]